MNTLTEWNLKLTENVGAVMKKLGIETGEQAKKLDNLQAKTKSVGDGFSNLKGLIIGAGVGIFAGEALAEYQQAAAANAQLKASYLSTNNAVGKSYEELQALSDKVAASSIYDDDDVTKAQSVLLTFTNIHGAIYDQAMPAIADLASKMGGDLQGSVVQVGKALNSPIEGVTALTKVGVSFTEQQKSIIKHYVDIGQTAKAQQLIIGELNKEFGGSAKAALDANPVVEIQKQFKEVQESLGSVIMQLIVELKPAIMTVVNALKTGVEWLSNNWTTISDVFSAVVEWFKVALVVIAPFIVYMGYLEAQIWLTNLAWLANPAVLILAGIVVAIVAVIAAIAWMYNKVEWFRGSVSAVFGAIKAIFVNFSTLVADVFGGIYKLWKGLFSGNLDLMKEGLYQAGDAYIKYGMSIGEGVAEGYNEGVKEVRDGKLLAGTSLQDKVTAGAKPTAADLLDAGGKPAAKDQLTKGMDGVSGGGQVRNVTVNITKMADIHINTTHLKESMGEVKRIVEETIIRAVSGSELALS
jgi:hypothetical protein